MPPEGSNKATSHPGLSFRYGHFLLHSVGVSNEKDSDGNGNGDDGDDERDASAAFLDRATNSSSPSNKAPHFVKKDFLVLVLLLWLLLFHNRSMFGKASNDRRFQRVQSTSPSASKVRINRARSEWLDPIPIGLPSTSVTTACSLLLLPEVSFDATNDPTRCFAMEAPTGPFPITIYDDTNGEDGDDTAEAIVAPEKDLVLDIDEPTRIPPVRGRRIQLRKCGSAMVGSKHRDDVINRALFAISVDYHKTTKITTLYFEIDNHLKGETHFHFRMVKGSR